MGRFFLGLVLSAAACSSKEEEQCRVQYSELLEQAEHDGDKIWETKGFAEEVKKRLPERAFVKECKGLPEGVTPCLDIKNVFPKPPSIPVVVCAKPKGPLQAHIPVP